MTDRSSDASGPLAGVRVLDLSRLIPGGHATLILAELGADVVKVEDPRGGDGTRDMEPRAGSGESGLHLVLNRGKRSVAIDTTTESGRAKLRELVRRTDVLIDSFRPGVLNRMGVGPDILGDLNPALVQVGIAAFDATSGRPGHDLNALGESGLLSLTPGGIPHLPPTPISDLSAGFQVAIAVLAGLRAREHHLSWGPVTVSMADTAMGLLGLAEGAHAATGVVPEPGDLDTGGHLTGGLACYDVYECADHRWVTVASIEPKFFAALLQGLDIAGPEWKQRQVDPKSQSELRQLLAQRFATETRARWLTVFSQLEACVGPVNNVTEAFADAVRRGGRGLTSVHRGDGSDVAVARAVPWLAVGSDAVTVAPGLGEHNDEVFSEWGTGRR